MEVTIKMIRRATHLLGTAIRETGQMLDRFGLKCMGDDIFNETYSRHRPIMNLYDQRPTLSSDVFIAPSASVIGKVLIDNRSSVWYGAVVRGGKNKITIGSHTNVQDRAVINCSAAVDSEFPADVLIGNSTSIGHGAVLTSCAIGSGCLIGQGAIIQEGSQIQNNCLIAAGTIVLPGTIVPSGQLWAGNPAAYVRDLSNDEKKSFETLAESYSNLAEEHAAEFLPFSNTMHLHAEVVNSK